MRQESLWSPTWSGSFAQIPTTVVHHCPGKGLPRDPSHATLHISLSLPTSSLFLSPSKTYSPRVVGGNGGSGEIFMCSPVLAYFTHIGFLPWVAEFLNMHGRGRASGGREGASLACSLGCLDTPMWSSGKLSGLESGAGDSFMLWNWMKLLRVRVKIGEGEKVPQTQEQKLPRGE